MTIRQINKEIKAIRTKFENGDTSIETHLKYKLLQKKLKNLKGWYAETE